MDAALPSAGAVARFRSALRCATMRRARVEGHVLHRWAWLLPRVAVALAVGGVVRLAGPASLAAAPDMHDPPAREELCVTTSFRCPGTAEPLVVVISKTRIFVGDDPTPVVELPPRDALVQSGLAATVRRDEANPLLIVPLAEALTKARDATKAKEAVIVADAGTPYRLLAEVLYTLGYCELGKYHLMVRSGKKQK
jgi:hypothetical protein